MNIFINVFNFDRDQCQALGHQDTGEIRRDAWENLLDFGGPSECSVLAFNGADVCTDVCEGVRNFYRDIMHENLPPAICLKFAELKRKLEDREGE